MISGKREKAFLVLEDGTVFSGYSVGERGTAIGEVVFNTCTASYEEVLSDPTYYGQIVAQTYPLVGNRGVEGAGHIAANGYIVREWCDTPSDARGETLDNYLRRLGIVGLCGIDTRALTRCLRGRGYVKGAITDSLEGKEELLKRISDYSIRGAVAAVTVKEPEVLAAEREEFRVAVIDYGTPRSLLDALHRRNCTVHLLPAGADAQDVKAAGVDAVVFSDGPGDPDDESGLIEKMRGILALGLPFIGIGLGHQMAALAIGGSVVKMALGHRGSNQPVRRLSDGRLLVTTQNHGYCVQADSVDPAAAEVSMFNVNDGTVEAIRYLKFPGETYQFTPVDSPEHTGTSYLYDAFIDRIREGHQHG